MPTRPATKGEGREAPEWGVGASQYGGDLREEHVEFDTFPRPDYTLSTYKLSLPLSVVLKTEYPF